MCKTYTGLRNRVMVSYQIVILAEIQKGKVDLPRSYFLVAEGLLEMVSSFNTLPLRDLPAGIVKHDSIH
jgi:hypothetical protein